MLKIYSIFLRGALLCAALMFGTVIQARAGYLYVMNDNTTGNSIYGYSVNEATGALTLLSGFPVATGGNGSGLTNSEQLTIDRANNRLYAINENSNTISAYSINPATGALTALPFSPIALPAGFAITIAVHPSGSPLVIGDFNNQVFSYVVTATTATLAAGSPFSTGTAIPFSSVFSRDGNFFYIGGNSGNIESDFAGFSVNAATGVLTALAGSPFNSGAENPMGYATDSQGRLFMANYNANQLRVFTTASGIPSPVSGNPFTSGLINAVDGVLSPNEQFYLVADRSGNQVGSYQIAGTGAATTLTAVGSPVASGGTLTDALVFNSAGTFLFAANGNSRNITTYGFNQATGALTFNNVQAANTLGAAGILTGIDYLATAVTATTFTVNQTGDAGDGVCDTTCTLRDAILAANANVGVDTIAFNIPGAGPHTISPTSALPTITDAVVIDGYTQPGSSANTNATGAINAELMIELNGSGAGNVNGLTITAGGSTVRGLVINRFSRGGIVLQTNGGNRVEGNFIGTNADGNNALGNNFEGVFITGGAQSNTIGGTTAAARNIISGNTRSGIGIFGVGVNANNVQGNLIGVDATGGNALGNVREGVFIGDGAQSNTIGGSEAGARNVISGNMRFGVLIYEGENLPGGASNNVVQGNYIGTDISGANPLGNNLDGVVVARFVAGFSPSNNNIIGLNADGTGAGNIIAFNNGNGVTIGADDSDPSSGNAIRGNAIFSNGGLGIDLAANGVTANDTGDGDTGPNNLQNYPVINSASFSGGNLMIQGSLNSAANTTYRVEFFSNQMCDTSSFGEGQNFLGFANVTTDGSGNTVINTTLTGQGAASGFLTSTATDPNNNTSEFSQCAAITSPPSSTTFTVNQAHDAGDGVCDATCTLRDAVLAANAATSNDVINFAAGLTTITLTNDIGIVNNGTLTINGLGANVLTIDGGAGTNRIFSINIAADVTITEVTLTGGNGVSGFANGEGGAIAAAESTLTLDRVHVTGNSAARGGGVSIFYTGNTQFPVLRISNSTFSNNRAGSPDGGNGSGGGLSVFRAENTVNIVNSTFSGNSANDDGGGISVDRSTMTLRSVTITGNMALGISNTPSNGGGIIVGGTNSFSFGNSIIAGNTVSGAGASGPEIFIASNATGTSAGFNLVGDSAGDAADTGIPITYQSTDILDTNPMLAPLMLNPPGSTPTHALLSGSPAIDKGSSFGSTSDQRGSPRPVDNASIPPASGGDNSDIGAFEAQLAPTAASVSIGGRVATFNGRGISKARITLTDSSGETRTALTNGFGYYRFDELAAGETYILEVKAKHYQFDDNPRVLFVGEELLELNFTALPELKNFSNLRLSFVSRFP